MILTHPERDQLDLPTVLHALSDPVRLGIVAALAAGAEERSCGSFDVSVRKSTCTHHFRVLLEARFPGLLDTVLAASQTGGRSPTQ
jgi:DNA-binding transcriptional ArsR family regulator